MFRLSQWITNSLIEGYTSGEFSEAYIAVTTANYITKNVLQEEDAQSIHDAIQNIKDKQTKQENVMTEDSEA